jgi:hypothetical protein
MVMSITNFINASGTENCTMDNCILGKPDNELWTCNVLGDCAMIGLVPGLCSSNQNCTQYASGVNYAFQNICYDELTECDVSVTNSVVWQGEGTPVQTGYSKLAFGNINESLVVTKSTKKSNVHYFPEWKDTINGTLVSNDPFPFPIRLEEALIGLTYNGEDKKGVMKFMYDGKIQLFWVDESNNLRDNFDCYCHFHGKIIL